MKKLFAQTYYTFFVSGMMALMIGSIMPFVADDYGLSYTFRGTLLSMHSIGNVLASFIIGGMIPAIGRKKSIVLMSSLIFLSFLGIMLTGMVVPLIVLFLLTGIGRGSVSNVNNAIVNDNAVGRSEYLNLLHTFFAVGAFVSPLMAATLMGRGFSWRIVVIVGLCLSVSMVILYTRMPIDTPRVKRGTKVERTGKPFYKIPDFYLAAGVMGFYLASESSVIGWVVTYLIDTGRMSESGAQLTLSLFWVVMMAGRLTAAFLSTKIRKTILVLASSIGAAIMFVVFITSPGGPLTIIAIIAFSFCFAGIYPTTVAATGPILKGSSGAMAMLLAAAGIGGIVMPQVIGMAAENVGISFGMTLLVITVLLTVACAIGLHIRHRKAEQAA